MEKIININELVKIIREDQRKGRTVVQSHGIFDLIHPGIIKHINDAKSQGDTLVVTVIKDKDVRRGSGRPIFPEGLRAENVASLEQVDYVCVVDDIIPFECVGKIKPDIFAKGQAYKERDKKVHKKIFEEEKEFYFGKSLIFETKGFSFSSSSIINNFLDIYPEETKQFLREFSRRYSFDNIAGILDSLKDLKVLIIGDGIIDEYHYCEPLGRSSKNPIIVNKYVTHEIFAGGAFIIANHVSGVCNKVHLLTLLGKSDSREDFIKNNLRPNIETKFFYRDDGPTIVKKRYIDQYRNQKLFEVNYLNDSYIDDNREYNIINYLKTVLPDYDLVLVSDFGHGFITSNIIRTVQNLSKLIAVNTQTNAANTGYNMITKYRNPHFVCLDESEARLATQEKFLNIESVGKKLTEEINADYLIVTLGKNGSIGLAKNNSTFNRTPIFSTKVIDTVGAGDAFFAFTAPCLAKGVPLDLVSFIGNTVGALAVQIVGNKKPVEKYELLEFVHSILR